MGLLAALLSAFFSSSKDLVSKRLSFDVDGTLSAFASFLFALPYYVVLLFILWMCGMETFAIGQTALILVLLRAVTDTVAELLKMHAFSHADISLLASVFALYPLFLLFVSPIITGDELSKSTVVAILLIVFGSLILVYRPSSVSFRLQRKGMLLGVGSAMCFALNSSFDRLAAQRASPALSGFLMTALSAFFLFFFVVQSRKGFAGLKTYQRGFLVRGFFEVGFMVLKLTALQYLTAPTVVAIQKSSLLLSIVGGRVLFKEEDFGRRLLAGVFVFVGILIATIL